MNGDFILMITLCFFLSKTRCTAYGFLSCSSIEFKGQSHDVDIILNNNLGSNQICRVQSTNRTNIEFEEVSAPQGSALAYDSSEDALYYSSVDGFTIRKTYLDAQCDDHDTEDVFILDPHLRPTLGSIVDLSLDWVTRNIFIAFQNAIGLVNPARGLSLHILHSGESFSAIDVHPNRGYLFLLSPSRNSSDNNSCTSLIIRAHQDFSKNGTWANATNPYREGRGCESITSMTIDYVEDIVYYVRAPFVGITRKRVDGSGFLEWPLSLYHATPLAVDRQFVYLVREKRDGNKVLTESGIKRVRKNYTYYDDWTFELKDGSNRCTDMVLPNKEMQTIEAEHPCAVNNGGCEGYCLAIPGEPEQEQKILKRVCI